MTSLTSKISYVSSNSIFHFGCALLLLNALQGVSATTANVVLSAVGPNSVILTVTAKDATPADMDFNQGIPTVTTGPATTPDPTAVVNADKTHTLTYTGLEPSTDYELTLADVKEGTTQGTGTAVTGGTQNVKFCTSIAPIEGFMVDAAATDDTKITVKWTNVAGRTHNVYVDGTKVTNTAVPDGTSTYEITATDTSSTPLTAGKSYTCKVVTSVSCDSAGDGSNNIAFETYSSIPCVASATANGDCKSFAFGTKGSTQVILISVIMMALLPKRFSF